MERVQKCMKSFGIMAISVLGCGARAHEKNQPPKPRDYTERKVGPVVPEYR